MINIKTVCVVILLGVAIFFGINSHAEETKGQSRATSLPTDGSVGVGGSGTVTPDLFTGTMSYAIPIEVPAGRKGIQPAPALVYRSNNGNSWTGVGWELEVGSIERSTKNGVTYDDRDTFLLKIAGSAVELVYDDTEGFYRAKIEGGFLRLSRVTSGESFYWHARDKSGKQYVFGQTSSARQDDPSNSARVFKWHLNHVEDVNGNFMNFTFTKPQNGSGTLDGQVYLTQIAYTGNSGIAPTNFINFHFESRVDTPDLYITNFRSRLAYRLKTIDIWSSGKRVRAYDLEYDVINAWSGSQYSTCTGRSLLTKIQQYGSDAELNASNIITSGTSLPATTFQWQHVQNWQPDRHLTGMDGAVDGELLWSSEWMLTNYRMLHLGDFNGDGKGDILLQGNMNGQASYLLYSTGSSNWDIRQLTGEGETFGGELGWTGQALLTTYRRLLVADFNGDGKSDIFLQGNISGQASWVLYSTGTSVWDAHQLTGAGGAFGGELGWKADYMMTAYRIAHVGDFNGDGKSDILLQGVMHGQASWVLYSTGTTAWDARQLTGVGETFGGDLGWTGEALLTMFRSLRVGDFNGDGKSDILAQGNLSKQATWVLYGTGAYVWDAHQLTGAGDAQGGELAWKADWMMTAYRVVHIGDFNGDGKSDILLQGNIIDQASYLLYATGTSQWDIRPLTGSGSSYGGELNWTGAAMMTAYRSLRIGDFNGDGMSDIFLQGVQVDQAGFMIFSTGTPAWDVRQLTGSGSTQGGELNWAGAWMVTTYRIAFADDFNGDGKTDILLQGNFTGQSSCILEKNSQGTDLLSGVNNGLGGQTTITYSTTHYDNYLLPFPVHTVSSVTNHDGTGLSMTTNYSYYGGYYHVGERDFRGFNRVRVSSLAPNNKTKITELRYHQGDDTDIDVNIYSARVGHMKGKLYRTIVMDERNTIFSNSTMRYYANESGHSPSYYFTPLAQTDMYTCDNGATVCDANSYGRHTRTNYYYDLPNDLKYGNVSREVIQGGDAGGNTDRTVAHSYSYTTDNIANWTLSLPTKESTFSGIQRMASVLTATPLSSALFFYDEASTSWCPQSVNMSSGKGNLTRIVRTLDGVHDPEVRMGYDAYGNLICTRDARGYVSTIDYDGATHTLPTTVTNALGHQTSTQYYTGLSGEKGLYGQVMRITDPNLNATTFEYDKLGRKTKAITPNGSTTWDYVNFGMIIMGTTNESQHILVTSSEGPYTRTFFDGFGRTKMQKKSGPDNKVIVTKTLYDQTGSVIQTTLPFFEGDGRLYTYYEYDFLGRTTKVTNPDFTRVKSCFKDGAAVVIDANGHAKRSTNDGMGRLVKIEEFTGIFDTCTVNLPATPYATTTYQYDVLGHLRFVTDAQGNQTEMHYDMLGRKDYMVDPDMGRWTYEYDANGNLTKQVDAKGLVDGKAIYFTYDPLNRLISKDYPTLGTHVVTYLYDETWSENAKGRRTTMHDASGDSFYFYDPQGRTKRETKRIDSNPDYTTQYSYDGLGRVKTITYPGTDSEVVKYTYDAGGNISLVGKPDGSFNYVAYADYTALGQARSVSYGNGVNTTYTYYPENNLLHTIYTSATSTTLLDLTYGYDAGGYNITSITDNTPREIQPPHFDEAASYDYGFGGTKPHALARNLSTGETYTYDPNGNMSCDGTRSIGYDYDNMPVSIAIGNQSSTYIYDGNGARVRKISNSSGTITYIGKLYECNPDGTCSKYIFAGGQRIAHKSPSSVVYYHADHLGSTRAMSASAGAKAEDIQYFPFGETRLDYGPPPPQDAVSMPHKYTSQEFDAETGLYYYNARYYNPAIGRFISADTIVPNYADPQMLNRYSYVGNNPLKYNDPSGHGYAELIGAGVGAVIGGYMAERQGGVWWKGAIVGGIAGYTGAWVGGAVGGATGSSLFGGLVGGAAGGAAGGLASAAVYGGSVRDRVYHGALSGAAGGAVGGVVGGALSSIGTNMYVAGAAAGAAGGYAAGYVECGNRCAAQNAVYGFVAAVAYQSIVALKNATDPISVEESAQWRKVLKEVEQWRQLQSQRRQIAWYIDINITGGTGAWGGNMGLQIGSCGIYWYEGIGYGTGAGTSITFNSGNPEAGFAITQTASGGTGNWGAMGSVSYDPASGQASGQMGIGWGLGMGYSATGTYTYPIWEIN